MIAHELSFDERAAMAAESERFREFYRLNANGAVDGYEKPSTQEASELMDRYGIPRIIYYFDFRRRVDGTYQVF